MSGDQLDVWLPVMSEEFACFFAQRDDAGPCLGRLVAAHLLPRQLLRREYRYGCVEEGGRWWPLERGEERHDLPYRSLDDLIRDPRSVVPMCGGLHAHGGHHGQVVQPPTLRVAREELPEDFIEYVEELGLLWWIERTYKERQAA